MEPFIAKYMAEREGGGELDDLSRERETDMTQTTEFNIGKTQAQLRMRRQGIRGTTRFPKPLVSSFRDRKLNQTLSLVMKESNPTETRLHIRKLTLQTLLLLILTCSKDVPHYQELGQIDIICRSWAYSIRSPP